MTAQEKGHTCSDTGLRCGQLDETAALVAELVAMLIASTWIRLGSGTQSDPIHYECVSCGAVPDSYITVLEFEPELHMLKCDRAALIARAKAQGGE